MRLRGRGLSAFPRCTAMLVAVACVWAQLASQQHLSVTPHVACAEHGEAMDAPVEAAHQAEPLSASPTLHSGADPVHGQGHEHCSFALHARQHAAPVSPSSGSPAALAAWQDVAAPLACAPDEPLLAVYRLAPKTSPPA